MTLYELIKKMELTASRQQSVNMVVENDIYRLNTYKDARYGVFAWVQGQHSASVDSDLVSYSFYLYYVDRLTEDESNQVEIQSVGISTLDNIIKSMEEYGVYASDYSIQAFNRRFLDNCAGVYCNVTFQAVKTSLCAETYADFNADFNEDFLII